MAVFRRRQGVHPLLSRRSDHARQRQEPADRLAPAGGRRKTHAGVSRPPRQRLLAVDADHDRRHALHAGCARVRQRVRRRIRRDDLAAGTDGPDAGRNPGQSTRGVDYWRGGSDSRIFVIRGEYLYALNAKTGKVYPDSATTGGRACISTRANRWPADSTTAPGLSSSATWSSSPGTRRGRATAVKERSGARRRERLRRADGQAFVDVPCRAASR